MKNPFVKTLSPTDKAVQVARELITTIERVAEIGDLDTTANLWEILSGFSVKQSKFTKEDAE